MKNKRECQQGVSSILRGAATLKPREVKVVGHEGRILTNLHLHLFILLSLFI